MSASDRTKWPKGPWDDEPDRVEWRMSEPPGYPLLIVRGPVGSLCGYVGVPPGHPLYRKVYSEPGASDLEVHGGLTYSGECRGDICHAPAPGEPDDVWWFGFDTAHAGDYVPGIEALLERNKANPEIRMGMFGERYRDIPYVRAEVERLAIQLARIGG